LAAALRAIADAAAVPVALHLDVVDSAELMRYGRGPDLQRSVRAGIVKVHVGTALDRTFSSALRRSLRHSKIVDPRSYLAEVRTALTETGSVVLEASVAVARRGCRRAG
jgi:fructose/tagatose bisphosphate aldolase